MRLNSDSFSGGWLIFSGAVIAAFGEFVIPWMRSMRGREAGVTGTTFVIVGIVLIAAGFGLRRGWWH